MGSAADVERAGCRAGRLPAFAATTREERLDLFARIGVAYKKRYDDMAQVICTEMGAPLKALAGSGQAGSGLFHFRAAATALQDFVFEKPQGGTRILREPIGVCGLITPWN